MKAIKKLLLTGLFITCIFSQTTSLKDYVKDPKTALPANCLYADNKNQCITCAQNFSLQKGQCVQIDTASSDFNPDNTFVPCGKQDSCGEAKTFKNDKQFQNFSTKYATPIQDQIQVLPGGVNFEPYLPGAQKIPTIDTAQTFASFASAKALPAVNPSRDFSTTNNQVNGVDEADLLKTDGTYIYTISNQILSIILAYPASKAKLVSKTNFNDFTPSAIFVQGDYLAVFGTKWQNYGISYPYAIKRYPSYSVSYTFIKIYDVSNRGKPFLLKQFQVSGNYFDGRKLENGFMYLITNQPFSYIARPWFDFGQGKKNVLFSSIFYYPVSYVNPNAVNIISFNLGDPINGHKKVVSICAESANLMYMSEKYIYLTSYSYENNQQYTKIRKIFVWGNYIKPFADGKVQGSINNQFSMDQYGQFFRVATTSNQGGSTSNNIFVLNYYLNAYGSLTGIAPGQRIFSARYVRTRCYLVTFQQIDPFFVISLKNHRKPAILGQLKVTGFSRYLHPYDETSIIGLGRQSQANGRQLGLKISIFDVSDVKNPKVTANFEVQEKYANSIAEFEHKAFLFSADKNLLVIPANMDYDGTKFNGALAFYITKNEITLKSIIDHVINPSDNFYQRSVERSLYIEQLLYTKSQCLLRINKISDIFEGVKNINIPCDQIEFYPVPILRQPVILKPIPIDPRGPIALDIATAKPLSVLPPVKAP